MNVMHSWTTMLCLCLFAVVVKGTHMEKSIQCHVSLKVDNPIAVTEEEYLSFTLDPFLLCEVTPRWGGLNFSHPRIHTLARGLSPAILRYGGTDSCWQMFETGKPPLTDHRDETSGLGNKRCVWGGQKISIYPEDVDNLRNLAASAGGKLLYDLNIQLRYGHEWDPSNAIELMNYIKRMGYSEDFDFELGNSPPKNPDLTLTGTQIGEDFMILYKLLRDQPEFRNSRLVGPDSGGISSSTKGPWAKTMRDFVKVVQRNLTAVTIHLYYFNGPGAPVASYIDVHHFDSLQGHLEAVRKVVQDAGGEDIDLWIGETSDAENEGTPNVSDRFVSGFLWLDKLGTAARMGYKLVARQIFFGGNYPLLNTELQPNPDYWLSFVYKKLVGTRVLDLSTTSPAGRLARVYAHCTSPRSGYASGSITLYAINLLRNASLVVDLGRPFEGQTADAYVLTPDGPGGLVSPHVALNSKRMRLVNDHTLPKLTPRKVEVNQGLKLPELSFGFFVLPEANARGCKSEY